MKLMILALYDVKVAAYQSPFYAQSVGAAIRSLSDVVNGRDRQAQDTPLLMHPEDFRLFSFGVWNDEGEFVLSKGPQLVAECANLKESLKVER